jgi:hypothetical protein
MKLGKTYKWWNNLEEDVQMDIFMYWRKISTSTRKHLCLDEINASIQDINFMLEELHNHNTTYGWDTTSLI